MADEAQYESRQGRTKPGANRCRLGPAKIKEANEADVGGKNEVEPGSGVEKAANSEAEDGWDGQGL